MTHCQQSHIPVPLCSSPLACPGHHTWLHAPPLVLDLYKPFSEKQAPPPHNLLTTQSWHEIWNGLHVNLLPTVSAETFSLPPAQCRKMFRPHTSCSQWPYKMQLLTASGISHLYLEREAAPHANTWNRSEQRSWAVTEGPFTPGGLHKSSLDRRCLISSLLGQLLDPGTAATDVTFAARRLGDRLQLPNLCFVPHGITAMSAKQRGSPIHAGPRLSVFFSSDLTTGACSPLARLIYK